MEQIDLHWSIWRMWKVSTKYSIKYREGTPPKFVSKETRVT